MPRLKSVKPIPPRLELLISWLLAKQARERPPSMRHVADEMNAVLQDTLGLDGAAIDPAAESEAALVDAAAENLTPAVMADEDLPAPATDSVRELEDIDPGVLPKVDELRAQVVREQRTRNRKRGWIMAAGLVVVAGTVYFLLPQLASEQKVDVGELDLQSGPSDAEIAAEKKGEELVTQHTALAKRVTDLDARAAASWDGVDFAAARKSLDEIGGMLERKKYEAAQAPLTALDKSLSEIEARVPVALAAQNAEGKRALTSGEFENARQAYETALKIEPGNSEATDGLAKVASASGVLPTLADAENAENAGDLAKSQALFAEVLKRNPGNVSATEGLARVKHSAADQEFNAEMGAGLAALNARRLPEARTHLEKAQHMRPGQHRGERRAAAGSPTRAPAGVSPTSRIAPRNSPARNAGPRRRPSTTKRWRAIPRCSSPSTVAPQWRRARNWANDCRHSSTSRSAWPKTRCAPTPNGCWRAPVRSPTRVR